MEFMVCGFGEQEEHQYIPRVQKLGVGVELQSYGLNGCKSPESWNERLRVHKVFRDKYPGRLAIHGPFLGIEYAYTDHLMRDAVNQRMEQIFQATRELHANRLVLHTGFKLEIYLYNYWDEWVRDTVAYWKEEIKRYEDIGVTVVLENVVEPDPSPMIELHDRIDHRNLKFCLDTGHVNVWSKLPPALWIKRMGNRLAHMHIHDNNGRFDEHLPMGRGNMDFNAVFRALHEIVPDITASLEVMSDKPTIMANLEQMIQVASDSSPD